jgi:hypothetical protein
VEKLKAYTIKDNAGFGEWDWDDLANEWCDAPLSDWGVDVWEPSEEEVKTQEQQKDLSDKLETSFRVEVTCINEAEQEMIYNELTNRGLICKILTL